MTKIRTRLKFPGYRGTVDHFISYVTDALPLHKKLTGFYQEFHPDGAVFSRSIATAGETVLQKASTRDQESAQAQSATKAQTEALKSGRSIAAEIRKRGRYVANELRTKNDRLSREQAREIETSVGVGHKINLDRQTGIRRLLTYQQAGLRKITPIFAQWKQPQDLITKVDRALLEIERSIREQSKEQIEADIAYDALEMEVEAAVKTFARAYRLLNLERSKVPDDSWNALYSIQGDHPDVFYQATAEEMDDELDDELDTAVVPG